MRAIHCCIREVQVGQIATVFSRTGTLYVTVLKRGDSLIDAELQTLSFLLHSFYSSSFFQFV